MSDESVKICNTIIQEEEYYSDIQGEYIAKKNNLNSKYKNSLIGVVVTIIFFIIFIIIGIILLFIKNKKNKSKNSKIDVKKIIAIILFILASICSVTSIGLGYFTNKNKNAKDNLVEPVIDDKYRPCYSSAQKKLIIDQVEPPKNINQLGLDLSGFNVDGLGTFTYSQDSSNMQDTSGNSLTSNQTRDKQSSYSGTTSSYYDTNASAGANSSNTSENRRGNTNNSTSNASASSSGGTRSQVNLLI
jgi:preprotein translocase subunit SecG